VNAISTNGTFVGKRSYTTPLTDPENKGTHSRGTNFDTLGAWDNRLDLPLQLEQSIKLGKPIPRIAFENIGYASVLGRRDYQEDRVKIAEIGPNLLYFGVFDGHGGPLAADYVSEFLEDHIAFWMKKEDDMRDVLRNSFIDVNNAFSRHMYFRNLGNPSCQIIHGRHKFAMIHNSITATLYSMQPFQD
jgi:protein phosphatase 1K